MLIAQARAMQVSWTYVLRVSCFASIQENQLDGAMVKGKIELQIQLLVLLNS